MAYGLLSPEDLVDIHKIGDQMLEITGDQAIAAERARASVEASEAERKRLKEQKKAESAERKRKHAADVAERKACDITFASPFRLCFDGKTCEASQGKSPEPGYGASQILTV